MGRSSKINLHFKVANMKRRENRTIQIRKFFMKGAKAVTFLHTHSTQQIYNRIKAEIYRNKTFVKHSPCNLSINLTTDCNMNCAFCSTRKYRDENTSQHLSLSRAKILLNKFNSAHFVGFCGAGEPFLNPDLFRMARYANQLRMKVIITTNGTLLDRRMSEIVTSNIHTLEISLKATCPEEYACFTSRKEEEFFSIINSVSELSKIRNRPRLVMTYVCNRKRIYNIPHLVDIAEECKVDELTLFNLIPSMAIKNESDCLYEDDKQLVLNILEPCLAVSARMVVNIPRFYSQDSTRRNCTVPFRSLKIGADGGISGCTRAIDTNLEDGNAFSDNDVFNNEHLSKLRDELINNNVPLRYECLYCGIRCM